MLNSPNKYGAGRYIDQGGDVKEGKFILKSNNEVWFKGTEAKKFEFLTTAWPEAGRTASSIELQLANLFDGTPKSTMLISKVKNYMIKDYVKYPLQTMLNFEHYKLDTELEFTQFVGQQAGKSWLYAGQVNKDF